MMVVKLELIRKISLSVHVHVHCTRGRNFKFNVKDNDPNLTFTGLRENSPSEEPLSHPDREDI